jgi:ferredoxin-NADP reductase
MPVPPWRKGIVTRIQDETYNTKRFWVEVPELETFDFKAGQFVTLDLPIHEKPNKRWRSYSISSWPNGTNEFELVIVLMEGGLGTKYLFDEIRVGSELTIRGPQGVFVLPTRLRKISFSSVREQVSLRSEVCCIILLNIMYHTERSISFSEPGHRQICYIIMRCGS